MQTCTTPARRGVSQRVDAGRFSRFGSHLNGECGAPDTPASLPGLCRPSFPWRNGRRAFARPVDDCATLHGSPAERDLTQLAQNRHPSLNKSTSWSKSWHYIFGKVTGEKAFLDTNLSCRRESRGLVGVNCGGWHYIIKSMLRAT